MPRVEWSRERVIASIRDWAQCGEPLSNLWKRDQNLYGAAKRLHGSWRAALDAAGFECARKSWTEERIIAAIRAGHDSGAQLYQDTQLVAAAGWHFGTWGKALRAAGVQPRQTQRWDRQRIITEIQASHRRGVPIHAIWR